jgi:hypothetical protein
VALTTARFGTALTPAMTAYADLLRGQRYKVAG